MYCKKNDRNSNGKTSKQLKSILPFGLGKEKPNVSRFERAPKPAKELTLKELKELAE